MSSASSGRPGAPHPETHPGSAGQAETPGQNRCRFGVCSADFKARQNALKWILVTCFGYLGYKNARFGRIEAHEAVTAFGRDKLLTAKEICEERGMKSCTA